MYQIITYKSKPLKKATIILDYEVPKKKKEESLTYLIDGVEVNEEDLTFDEKLDIESESVLNQDGFYTPLLPIDFSVEEEEKPKNNSVLKVGLVIGGTLLLLAGVVIAMIMLL